MTLRTVFSVGGAAAALVLAGTVFAQPAPWYWWASKLNGQRVCAQFMPQQGWERAQGPYTNAQCKPHSVRR